MSDESLSEANRRMLNYLRDRVEELEQENDELRDKVSTLMAIVDPNPAADYDELPRERKVWKVRKALVEEALRTNGYAAMDYDDVRWLFDGQPSVGHCYTLMELAGKLDGFDYKKKKSPKRITAKIEAVKDETLIHAANKALAEAGG